MEAHHDEENGPTDAFSPSLTPASTQLPNQNQPHHQMEANVGDLDNPPIPTPLTHDTKVSTMDLVTGGEHPTTDRGEAENAPQTDRVNSQSRLYILKPTFSANGRESILVIISRKVVADT